MAELGGVMEARERARKVAYRESNLAEQIRQAEQAAREHERRKTRDLFRDWKCKAKPLGDGSGEPQDCAWPGCGCDPYADEVIEALEESGAFDIQAAREQALEEAAQVCETAQGMFGSTEYATNQPLSSHGERFACDACAEKIRDLKQGKTSMEAEHKSDCAVHNAPAYEVGECDCGAEQENGDVAQDPSPAP